MEKGFQRQEGLLSISAFRRSQWLATTLGPKGASVTGALLGDRDSGLIDVSFIKKQRNDVLVFGSTYTKKQRNETVSPGKQPFQGVSLLPGQESWSRTREGRDIEKILSGWKHHQGDVCIDICIADGLAIASKPLIGINTSE